MANDDPPKPKRPRRRSLLSVEQREAVFAKLLVCNPPLDEDQIGLLAEVFDDIYDLYEDEVRRQIRRWNVDEASVPDVLQEAMTDLYEEIIDHGFPRKIGAILQVITQRKIWKWLRARGRRRETLGVPSSGSEPVQSGPVSDLDRALDRRAKAEALLEQLPPEQRHLFELIFREELLFVEAAATLKIPERTLQSRVFALRKVLLAAANQFKEAEAAVEEEGAE